MEIDPYKNNENSIKPILIIYDVSKEDEGHYTLIVYYNTDVLEKFGIEGHFLNQTTGSVQVDINSKGSSYMYFTVFLLLYTICTQDIAQKDLNCCQLLYQLQWWQ